jgi:hypothetical protein
MRVEREERITALDLNITSQCDVPYGWIRLSESHPGWSVVADLRSLSDPFSPLNSLMAPPLGPLDFLLF